MTLFTHRPPALTGGMILLAMLYICSALWREIPHSGTVRTAAVSVMGRVSEGSAVSDRIGPDGSIPVTVVLDPGHGGEDGGAVSPEGVAESGINLEIALRVRDIFRLMGQPAVLTRSSDVSLGDPALGTVRQRKASDIRRRVEMVNGTENSILLSIHQNSLPSSPDTHGAQVFWNGAEGGQALAEDIQAALNAVVNEGNPKRAKAMGTGVYLMRHAAVPAALAECGFLSNGEETARLQTADHQREIAAALAAGCLRYLSEQPGSRQK